MFVLDVQGFFAQVDFIQDIPFCLLRKKKYFSNNFFPKVCQQK